RTAAAARSGTSTLRFSAGGGDCGRDAVSGMMGPRRRPQRYARRLLRSSDHPVGAVGIAVVSAAPMSQKHRRRQKRDAPPAPRPAAVPRVAVPPRPAALDRLLGAQWILPAILAAAALLRVANIVFLQASPFIA